LRLLLPGGRFPRRALGAVLGIAGLFVLGAQAVRFPLADAWPMETLYILLAAITLLAAVCTITFRNPVYSAIWFALTLLGTAGLMLIHGAQFVGVVTIVVYAGAILVTFLFVLMLAQPEGQAFYDRLSWEPLWASVAGAALAGILIAVIGGAFQPEEGASLHTHSFAELQQGTLAYEHTAELGGRLFSTHLVAVQVAGTLLLVALVAATAIVIHGKQTAPRDQVTSP
jgi:NADH-quinone oxidoreductase subunit J